MKLNIVNKLFFVGMISIHLFLSPNDCSASIQSFGFVKITNNGNTDVASQLAVDVWGPAGFTAVGFDAYYKALSPAIDVVDANIPSIGANQVFFVFRNSVGTAASICDIYFDDGTLLGISSIVDNLVSGVAFDNPATPGDLPGGNDASPDFNTTAGFSADSDPPVEANGVDSNSELVGILFDLIGGQTWAHTIAAMEQDPSLDGSLRIGLHVQAIGTTGGSDGYITNGNPPPPPPSIPEPASVAVWSLIVGLGAIFTSRSKR